MESQAITNSLKDFQSELDQKNRLALQELNRQIDELALIPIDSNLPPFVDSIEYQSPPKAFADTVSPLDDFKDANLTLQLEQDLKDFKKLSSDPYPPVSHLLDDRLSNAVKVPSKEQSFEVVETKAFLDQLDIKLQQTMIHDPNIIISNVPIHTSPAQSLSKDTEDLFSILAEKKPNNPMDIFRPSRVAESPLYTSRTNLLDNLEIPTKPERQPSPLFHSTLNQESIVEKEKEIPKYNFNFSQGYAKHQSSMDDSRAIVDALRTLQDRVGKLEGEKAAARLKIEGLEQELTTTRQLLFKQQQETSNQQYLANSMPVYHEPKLNSDILPQLEKPAEYTLEHIAQAQMKLCDLKIRVEKAKNFAESKPLLGDFGRSDSIENEIDNNMKSTAESLRSSMRPEKETPPLSFSPIPTPSWESKGAVNSSIESVKIQVPLPTSESKKHVVEKSNLFNSITAPQSHHVTESSIESDLKKFKSSLKSSPKKKDTFLAQEEILKLKKEIESERHIRLSQQHSDPDTIKEQILQKMKSDSFHKSKKDPQEKKEPVWKKADKKSKAILRESGPSAHLRKKAPIDVPTAVGPSTEDNGKREMPFIVGRNTGKSFSVTANLQRVFSLLKSHNPELCSVCSKKSHPCSKHREVAQEGKPVHVLDPQDNYTRGRSKSVPREKPFPKLQTKPQSIKESNPVDTNENLFYMLGVLEQEFRNSKEQYNNLVLQYQKVAESMTSQSISEATGSSTLKAIGEDLRNCIQTMETKSEQIKILRDIMTSSISLAQKKTVEKKKKIPIPKRYTMDTATSRSRAREVNEVQSASVDDQKWAEVRRRTRSQSPGRAMASLSLLKSTFKVQDALGETI